MTPQVLDAIEFGALVVALIGIIYGVYQWSSSAVVQEIDASIKKIETLVSQYYGNDRRQWAVHAFQYKMECSLADAVDIVKALSDTRIEELHADQAQWYRAFANGVSVWQKVGLKAAELLQTRQFAFATGLAVLGLLMSGASLIYKFYA